MISNETDLNASMRNLKIMREALQNLRNQLETTNPELMDARSKDYLTRIAKIHAEIEEYLAHHPEAQAPTG